MRTWSPLAEGTVGRREASTPEQILIFTRTFLRMRDVFVHYCSLAHVRRQQLVRAIQSFVRIATLGKNNPSQRVHPEARWPHSKAQPRHVACLIKVFAGDVPFFVPVGGETAGNVTASVPVAMLFGAGA